MLITYIFRTLTFSNSFLKEKVFKNFSGYLLFSRGAFSLGGGGTLPKIVINLTRSHWKLPCKGATYRFSG
jgi:hypothetical protein